MRRMKRKILHTIYAFLLALSVMPNGHYVIHAEDEPVEETPVIEVLEEEQEPDLLMTAQETEIQPEPEVVEEQPQVVEEVPVEEAQPEVVEEEPQQEEIVEEQPVVETEEEPQKVVKEVQPEETKDEQPQPEQVQIEDNVQEEVEEPIQEEPLKEEKPEEEPLKEPEEPVKKATLKKAPANLLGATGPDGDDYDCEVTVDGQPNGPYTITLSFTLNEGNAESWAGDTAYIDFSVANIVTFKNATTTISDTSATISKENDYEYRISGYDFGANKGNELVFTISNVEVNSDSDTVTGADAGLQNFNLFNSSFACVHRDGKDYKFQDIAQTQVPIQCLGTEGPTPTWNGKTASWNAVEGATEYAIRYSGPHSKEIVDTSTTETSINLSDYIITGDDSEDVGTYSIQVWAKNGPVQNQRPGSARKEFVLVKVVPTIEKDNYDEVGTDGGTVSGSAVSGDVFTEATNGSIKGIFAKGDCITITGTPKASREFVYYENFRDSESSGEYQNITENPFTFEVHNNINMYAKFRVVPSYAEVTLDFGAGHEDLASDSNLESIIADLDSDGIFVEIVSVNGTVVTLKYEITDGPQKDDTQRQLDYSVDRLAYEHNLKNLIGVGRKSSADQYNDKFEFDDEKFNTEDPLADGDTFYVLWSEPIDAMEVTLEIPTCSTEVSPNDEDSMPNVTVVDDKGDYRYGIWITVEGDDYLPFEGTIKGGETYAALCMIAAPFGYYYKEDITITATNGTYLEDKSFVDGRDYANLCFEIEAEHVPGDPVEENRVEPTDTEDGHYDEVVYCQKCDEELSRETKTIPHMITVTFHPSSRDGDDFADPIVLEDIPSGSTYNQVNQIARERGINLSFNNIPGYTRYAAWDMKKPMSEATSPSDALNSRAQGNDVYTEDTDLYGTLTKYIKDATITITPPECGTMANESEVDVEVPEDAKWVTNFSLKRWIKGESNPGQYTGVLEGDNDYYGYLIADLDWGYSSNNSSSVEVEGGEFVKNWMTGTRYGFFVKVHVDHEWTFKEIVWDGTESAKAIYECVGGHTEEVECTVEQVSDDAKAIVYKATVSAEDSLDEEEHTDEKTIYKYYNLYVGGKHVTGENLDDILEDGTVSYDPDTNTLTLNNATIEVAKRNFGDRNDEFGIRVHLTNKDITGDGYIGVVVNGPMTIALNGTNNIVNNEDEGGANKYGIVAFGNDASYTITGGGTLNISMNATGGGNYFGIDTRQGTTLDGVKVNIDIPGSDPTTGFNISYSNLLTMTNGSEMHINTGSNASTYGMTNNRDMGNIAMSEGTVLEVISENKAFNNQNKPTDATKELGVWVNEAPSAEGRKGWDETTDLSTYKYVRIPGKAILTLHWTSIDGDDLMDPIVYKTKPGNTYGQALAEHGKTVADELFSKDGYTPYGYRILEPLSTYSDIRDVRWNSKGDDLVINDDTDIYYTMAKYIDTIDLTIEPPVCGDETEVPEDSYYWYDQTNPPVVSTSGENYALDDADGYLPAVWIKSPEEDEAYQGVFSGGTDYYSYVWVGANFGYTFVENPTINVEGGTLVVDEPDGDYYGLVVKLTAEHVPGEPVEENRVEPTCEEDGSYEEVLYCQKCEEEISREAKIIPALGHDYGEWEVVKEATKTETGLMRRVCKHDASHVEEKEIPVLDPDQYTITLKLNGGQLNSSSDDVVTVYTEGTTITLPAPTREGYTFDYWEGSRYNAGDSYTVKENHTFNAMWKKIEPTPSGGSTPSKVTPHKQGRTCQDDGYPVGYYWSDAEQKCITNNRVPTPRTADQTNLMTWIVLMGIALVGIVLAQSTKKHFEA